MEACSAVEREIDKVLFKFNSINDHSGRTLQDLHDHIIALKREMDQSPPDHELTYDQAVIMKQTINKVRETVQRLATDHRDLHSSVSKVGKAIDRNFVADFGSTFKEDIFADPEKINLLNKVLCQHFYRQGVLDIAVELAKESGIETEVEASKPFAEINHILNSLRRKELGPALEWAQARRASLEANNSSLEFKLHRLHFINMLQGGTQSQQQALHYARANFPMFVKRHGSDIQALMGMLLFLPQGLEGSPYEKLLDPSLWNEIFDIFTKEACALLGLSVDSPLTVSINAGSRALPALLNIKQVMIQRQVTGIWSGKDELPIDIKLGKEHRYHSVFACPILRQQSSDANPPMRLVCGHVISRDAVLKLTGISKLKCPYCPVEQANTDAQIVYF